MPEIEIEDGVSRKKFCLKKFTKKKICGLMWASIHQSHHPLETPDEEAVVYEPQVKLKNKNN